MKAARIENNRVWSAVTSPDDRSGAAGDRGMIDRDNSAILPWIDRTIVLVGMMGAGKSTIGKRLAERVGLPFVDADAEIESAAGQSITDIFDSYGEESFRAGERRVIARLLSGPVQVIATGGGAFNDDETRALVKSTCRSVWLRVSLDTLASRVSRRNNRPLVDNDDPRATLERLIEEREPFYAEADIVIDSDDRPADKTVATVLDALRRLSSGGDPSDAR